MNDDSKAFPASENGDRFFMSESAEASTSKDAEAEAGDIPRRYPIKTAGEDRFLTCLETPNLSVFVKRGFTVSASTARKSPAGTIFLDGAAQGEPFLDHEKKIYNLDHHEGCVRSFTLSTCEQVLVMILKGLDLREREWKIYANEPDLDTVLSIWLIFNHLQINRKDALHIRFLYALVRLEGVIDALGLELKDFSALPPELMRKAQRVIDYLRKDEIKLKKDGLWDEVDYPEYTAAVLRKIDRIVYKSAEFTDLKGIKELARVDLTDDRIVAVVESDSGIYELEPQLNHLYGNRLGLVVLRKSDNTYTLRRMDLFMPGDLEAVYERLNFIDRNVRCQKDANRWGGSADIGGSPRVSGTHLSPREIARACREAMQKPNMKIQAVGLFQTLLLTAALVAAAEICRFFWPAMTGIQPSGGLWGQPAFGSTLTLLFLAAALLPLPKFRKTWSYGITLPLGKDWWWLLPVVLICGYSGGLWAPETLQHRLSLLERLVYLVLLFPLVSEFLFRGIVHGILAREAKIQYCQSRWFLSWPTVGAAVLYALFIGYQIMLATGSVASIFTGWTTGNIFAAFALGIAAGMVRERSQSIIPAYMFHALAALLVILTASPLR
jgi:hypothetical protein